MLQLIERILGILLAFLVLMDVFLLVLHARADTGSLSRWISLPLWRGFVGLSHSMGQAKGRFLSYAGPVILLAILASWFLLLTLAAALIIHPSLGSGIKNVHGETLTTFDTALYNAGHSLDFIGGSEYAPDSGPWRLFFLVTSIIGVALVPLIITYLLEVYNSLKIRNSLGLKVHLHSAETGDAAEIVAALGPKGKFETGYITLEAWASENTEVKESHHFHPILFFFRFNEPYYSISRTSLTSLDTVTLIQSALDENEYGWLKHSAAVEQLKLGTLMELKTLLKTFSPRADLDSKPPAHLHEQWRRRYHAAVERLQHAGIKTAESGAEEYVSLRSEWDRYIELLGPQFAFTQEEVDPTLVKVK